jgi:hypothetical protein
MKIHKYVKYCWQTYSKSIIISFRSSSCPGSKRKSEQDDDIQPRKRHNSNLEEVCDSRGQSAEKSLLETFIKHVSSFQSVSVLSKHDVGTFSSKQYPSDEQKYQLLRNHFIPKKTYEKTCELMNIKPETVAGALKICYKTDFPNIFIILKIIATLGVTSCECERSNSELTLLKTYLRTIMGQSRLNGLALMHVHYRLELNMKKIIDSFARKPQTHDVK